LLRLMVQQTLRRLLFVSLLLLVALVASAQDITLHPPADTIALIGSCTPPAFRWTITKVTPSLDRLVIRSYASSMGIGVPPDHMTARLDSVYFEIRDTVRPNTYRLRYINRSLYYPGECMAPADTEFWVFPGPFELTLLVLEDSCLVDSATMRFMGYQFGLAVKEQASQLPASPRLEPIYPNPFNSSAVVTFTLPVAGRIRLEAFDSIGRSVGILCDEYRHAGVHTIRWEPRALPSGRYFLRLGGGTSQSIVQSTLVK